MPGLGELFFQVRPGSPLPLFHRRCISFLGPLRGALQRPPHLLKDTPDVSRVVMHACLSFDHPGDSRERPEIGVESVGLRSPEEGFFHTLLLHGIQTTVSSRVSRTPPGAGPSLLPRLEPSAHTLPADPQLSRYVRLSLPLAKELRCLLPAVLKLVEVPSCSCGSVHVDILHEQHTGVNVLCENYVTILCEIQ
jgi:hypothetical protein